jgi:hypothetical protein
MWMHKHAIVVELLPWIPPWTTWGEWARFTNCPTPLGIIWMGTDLNHVGYRLPRESVPDCFNDTTKECFDHANFNFQRTDINVHANVITESISRFLLPENSTLINCSSWKERAGALFVLYNVQFADSIENQTLLPHHFFRELDGKVYDG